MRKVLFVLFAAIFTISLLFIGKPELFTSEVSKTTSERTILNQNPPENTETILQKQKIAEQYGKLPLHFEPNLGQTDKQVNFTARGQGYALFLTDNEAVLSLEEKSQTKRAVVKMKIEGANAAPKFAGLDETAGKTNYFIGNDPDKWQTDVPNYEKVKYSGVYDGVDLVYYGNNQRLEYDFVVAPNADPNQIKLKFGGIKKAEIEKASGDLLLETELGTIRQHKPFSYQIVEGGQKEIASLYEIQKSKIKDQKSDEFIISIKLAEYDKSKELVIDPILVYGSYLGGSLFDSGSGIAVDADGNAYITGTAASQDFPTTAGTIKPVLLPRTTSSTSFWYDAFVTKVNPAGTAIVFSTYFGGRDGNESGGDVEVDANGNVYFSGTTMASDFPTVNAYQTTFGGTDDGFLAKINPNGSAIIFSTYLGGNNTDSGGRIVIDSANGEVTVVGRAYSPNFPTTPGVIKEKLCNSPTTCSGIFYSGSFIARFNADGGVRYATLFDAGLNDVALDVNNNAVVAGSTSSAALTTPGAYQTVSTGGGEGYVGKINPTGSAITFGTLLGGGVQSDLISGISLDAAGNMYVAGTTQNAGFPTTPGAFDTTYNGTTSNNHDGFLTKFNPPGTALVYSTFLGGTGKDEPKGIALGSDNSAFVVGETTGSASFPLRNSIVNSGNIFLTHFNADASALVYSTILGQGGGYDIAVDAADNAYITGKTTNVPTTPDSFQPIRGGGQATSPDDGYILKIGPTDENVTHYAISGNVTDENKGYNNNYAAIVATITGTVNRSINLAYNGGQYYFGNLPAGGNYTVRVKKVGFETDPETVVFNNLGANQFADFTLLRNREPEATITSPAHGTTFSAPASITIRADAIDPDANDTIQKVEFSAYNSSVGSVPIGTDTTAPYEITWDNVPTGTWSLNAAPYDNHGLRGQTQNVVHVFVVDSSPVSVSFTSPTEGQIYQTGEYVTFSVNVSSSVNRVEIRDQNNNLIRTLIASPWSTTWRVMTAGNYTFTATASNSGGQTATSAPVSITVNPYNHRITGKISDSLTNAPVANVLLNLTSASNPSITATATTDSGGNYNFIGLGATPDDSVTITPVLSGYTFNPSNRNIAYLGFIDWTNQNFSAIADNPITVAMTSPNNGQTFPQSPTVTLSADASTGVGTITQVEFFKYAGNGQHTLIGTDTEAPYSFDWVNVAGGSHSVFARATNSNGTFNNSANVSFTVQIPPTSIRLQGDITNAGGNWMPGITVRLTGTVNGNPVNQTSVSNFFGAYGFFNLTPGGDYTITPEAPNTTFTPLSFSVTNAMQDIFDIDFQSSAFNMSPTVQINSPTDGAVFTIPTVIPVNITAQDSDGNIVSLSATAVGNNRSQTIAQANNGTINVNWQPTEPGEYIIYGTATDNGGLRTTATITITVNQPAPVSISGRIVDRNSVGIIAASVHLWDYSSQNTEPITTVLTDTNGNYTVPNVTTFENYRITVEKLNYTFAPQSRTYFDISTTQTNGDFTGTLQLQPSDFNGDGESDVAVWRPSDGYWYVRHSQTQTFTSVQFGGGSFGDVPVPGNYDGDNKIDVAVFRGGIWYFLNSSNGQFRGVQWGAADDVPVPGDYDGDGKTDIAVFRPSNGAWYILNSSDGSFKGFTWGVGSDIPLVGDFDGDGKADFTVFRPADGHWYISNSSDGSFRAFPFGQNGDMPLIGDFDGDKKTDFTVFRPTEGTWHIWQSATQTYRGLNWGFGTDTPVPGDYDRDGKTDVGVFRPSEGNWYVLKSSDNSFAAQTFGQNGDIPIPAAFTR